jgi:hypothetical protein
MFKKWIDKIKDKKKDKKKGGAKQEQN